MDIDKSKTTAKKGKLASLLLSLVQTIGIIFLVVISIATFGTRIPLFAKAGFNFFAVTSGSMVPKLPIGSLVYVGKFKTDLLKNGDIITYQLPNPDSKQPVVVTHRIVSIDKKEEKKPLDGQEGEKTIVNYEIKTKGDANNIEDAYIVKPGEIIGLYQWHLPYLGYLTAFAQTGKGFLLLVILPATILIVWEVISLIMYFKDHFESKSAREIELLKAELNKAKNSHE